MAGKFAPAIGGNFAVFGIKTDHDLARESPTGITQKTWTFHCSGADDDVADAAINITLNRVEIANAPTELNGDSIVNSPHNASNRSFIDRLTGDCAV